MVLVSRFIRLGFLASVAIAPNAMAQTAMEFACPAAGTKITFSNGNSTTVRGQEGFFCKNENSRGDAIDMYALLYPFTEARRRDPSWAKYIDPVRVERIWPLAVGKRHQGTANIGINAFYLDYRVVREEVIDTPMGPQNTFVVELVETSSGPYRANAKWWISPKFRYVIKYEFSSTLFPPSSFHVTGVSSPGDAPSK